MNSSCLGQTDAAPQNKKLELFVQLTSRRTGRKLMSEMPTIAVNPPVGNQAKAAGRWRLLEPILPRARDASCYGQKRAPAAACSGPSSSGGSPR